MLIASCILILAFLVDQEIATYIPVRTSDFSTTIIPLRVGTPPQPVLMGLSFDRDSSWLYSSGECPPFVECFKSSKSESFEFWGDQKSVSTTAGKADGYSCFDIFEVGAGFESEFVQVVHQKGKFLTGRDVAGQLAVGPSSDIALHHTIELMVDLGAARKGTRARPRWSMILDPVRPARAPGQIDIIADIEDGAAWKLSAELHIDSTEVYRKIYITFNPSIEEIIVPKSEQVVFLEHLIKETEGYHISSNGRLFLPCMGSNGPANTSGLNRISLRINPDTSRFVDILGKSLQFTGLVNTESIIVIDRIRYCPTRIMFHGQVKGWIFGIPLLASVQSAFLDASNSRITFRFLSSLAQRPDSVVPSSVVARFDVNPIPLFGVPETIISREGDMKVQFSTGWERAGSSDVDDLVLFSSTPDVTDEEKRFIFMKKRTTLLPPPVGPPTVKELEGVWQMSQILASLVPSPSSQFVDFDFQLASDPDSATYAVSIVNGRFTLQVVLTKVETSIDLKYFKLPQKTKKYLVNPSDDPCAICQDSLPEDEEHQPLPCGGVFHVACLERWLGSSRTCPHCRTPIATKEGSGPMRLRRATTPDPSDGYESSDNGP